MLDTAIVKEVLGDLRFKNGMLATDAIEDGYLFAMRVNEQTRLVTFFYLNHADGTGAAEETHKFDFGSTHTLANARQIKSLGQTHNDYVVCGDVYLRAGMVKQFRTEDEKVRIVQWNQSSQPYTNDIVFNVLGKAEITIRGIKNGVARPFTAAGFHVIPRGMSKPYFTVRKAEGDEAPLLLQDPARRPEGWQRIRTGSGNDVPRQFACI
ncbi:MAG: hypothetical protein K2Q32_03285 [Alphaproteobacteria bacterium]|nr:hypothetical protein [Alphaproteobacteria bacterium]